ncbi:hypothetical protein MAR_035311, partial [Mya arenaria]
FLAKDHITVDVSGILSSTDPDFLSDVDSTEYFQVMAVQSKKFADGKCPSCNKMPDTEQHNGSAMVRFFMDNLKKLFKVDDITDSNKLLQQLKTQVPVTARGRFTNTVWYNLSRVSTTVMAGYSPTTSCLIDIVYHLNYTQSQTLQTECSQISSYTVWGLLHHLELRNPSCRKTLVNNMYVTGNLDGCRRHDNDYGKLINNLFEQVENAEHTCDPHKVITILAHAQIVTHPDAHPCSDVQVGTNEDLVLNACNLTAPTTWTRGVNVMTICSSIPKYTPIASFQSSTGYSYHAEGGEQSGVLLECDTDGNGFKTVLLMFRNQVIVFVEMAAFNDSLLKYTSINVVALLLFLGRLDTIRVMDALLSPASDCNIGHTRVCCFCQAENEKVFSFG